MEEINSGKKYIYIDILKTEVEKEIAEISKISKTWKI